MAYKNLGGAKTWTNKKSSNKKSGNKNLSDESQQQDTVTEHPFDSESQLAPDMNYKERGETVLDTGTNYKDVSAGVTLTDPQTGELLTRESVAEGLLNGQEMVTGFHVDKDGNYLKTDGKNYAVDTITPPNEKSQLSDVSDRYVKAIEDDPKFKEALERLKAQYRMQRDEPWGELPSTNPPAVTNQKPAKEADEKFQDHYGDFYSKLAGLHMQGGYCKEFDSIGPMLEQRNAAREGLAAANPEMDTAMANQARHWLNVQDHLIEHGCDFGDCEFIGKDGKPMAKLPPNATPQQYQRYTDALVYAMDHDMISSVKGKDGKEIPGLPIKDEYTANLQYYDDHAADIAKYRLELESKTNELCEKQAEAHKGDMDHPEIGGCKITGVTNEQYYADAKSKSDTYLNEYESRVKSYEAGKNPMLDTLKHFGLDASGVQPQAQSQVEAQQMSAQAGNQQTIEEALNRSANVKAPEVQPEAELTTV